MYGIPGMKIVYVASEVVPFAATGGLADVGNALPKALVKQGVQVIRVMPLYRQIAEGGYALKDTGLRLDIPVGFQFYKAEIWMTEEPAPPTYFIRRDEFFDRTHLYGLADRDYDDNFERFVFFQKAVVALADALQWHADIIHCNDWQTGLLPLFLRYGINGMGRQLTEKIIFNIHNMAYQGNFPGSQYSLTNLPFFCFNMDVLEFYGKINCMKAGITSSDLVTTVSKTYAQEIQTEEFAFGLHGVLSRMGNRLVGITHGADYAVWDPVHDSQIAKKYSVADLSGKAACKADLIQQMNLKIKPETPLLGMVSRLVDQKGLDILAESMSALVNLDLGLVILGEGQEKYQKLCLEWAQRSEKIAVRIDYDIPLAHKILSGADIYMMPSRFEPAGLAQLYGLRYGSIPVVHATGGLEDTVEDISADGTRGTGFKFKAYTANGLLSAVHRALDLYRNREIWGGITRRAMEADFSWDRSSDEFMALCRKLLS